MKISIINNESFEGPAYIQKWAEENEHIVYNHKLFNGESLPTTKEFDMLIILGGTISVNDTDKYPLIEKIKDLILDCVRDDKLVFGVCLGSQMIASAFGAKVKPMGHSEIGFFNIEINNTDPSFKMFPQELTVAHWHGEMFDIPKGAKSIASSIACPNQIFKIGEKIFAFQCHLEMTHDSLINMIQNTNEDLEDGNFVQDSETILKFGKEYCDDMNSVLGEFMNELVNQSVEN